MEIVPLVVLKLMQASLVAVVIFHVDAVRRKAREQCTSLFFYAMLQILIFNINNALKLLAAATSEAQGKVTFLNLSLDKSLRSKLMAFMLEMKQLRLREVK